MIRDCDAEVDEVLASISIDILLTAPLAQQMNAYTERQIGSVRRECTEADCSSPASVSAAPVPSCTGTSIITTPPAATGVTASVCEPLTTIRT
jgi:hypothetical protein